jgi:hypothetical protein
VEEQQHPLPFVIWFAVVSMLAVVVVVVVVVVVFWLSRRMIGLRVSPLICHGVVSSARS